MPVIARRWKIARKMTEKRKQFLVYARINRDFGWGFLLKPSAPKISKANMKKSYEWAKVHKKIKKCDWVERSLFIDVKKWAPRHSHAMKKHQNAQKEHRYAHQAHRYAQQAQLYATRARQCAIKAHQCAHEAHRFEQPSNAPLGIYFFLVKCSICGLNGRQAPLGI